MKSTKERRDSTPQRTGAEKTVSRFDEWETRTTSIRKGPRLNGFALLSDDPACQPKGDETKGNRGGCRERWRGCLDGSAKSTLPVMVDDKQAKRTKRELAVRCEHLGLLRVHDPFASRINHGFPYQEKLPSSALLMAHDGIV